MTLEVEWGLLKLSTGHIVSFTGIIRTGHGNLVLLRRDMGQYFNFNFDTILRHCRVMPLEAPQPHLVDNMW